MKPIRVGIVGTGWIAARHVRVLEASAGVEVVAVCDVDPVRAQRFAAEGRRHAYERWEEMLDRERLDAVWICTPPLAHREPAVATLEAGIHVYLEKPIARTLLDAQAIVDAARRSGATCAVGYQWHATELLDVVREATAGQAIGLLTARDYGPVAPRGWFVDRGSGGGQLLERGSHHIDLQRAFMGEIEAVEVTAGRVALAQARATHGDIEDVLVTTLHFHTGAIGSISIAWTLDDQPEVYSMDVIATEATLSLELGPQAFRIAGVAGGRRVAAVHGDPFTRSIDRFLYVVRGGEPSRIFCTPEDALRTLIAALACERALALGVRVAVES